VADAPTPTEFAPAICWVCARKRGDDVTASEPGKQEPCIICGRLTTGRNYKSLCAEPAAPADSVPFIASRPELAYDTEQRPIRATHVSIERDGSFTIGGVVGDPGVGMRGQVVEPIPPEKIAAIKEDLVKALSSEMGPRMARNAVYGPAPVRPEVAERMRELLTGVPPVEHPAPWRWFDSILVDANGAPVIRSEDAFPPVIASPRLEELLRAAPEMEAALRWAIGLIDAYGEDEGYWPTRACGDDPNDHLDQVKALLARIEKAGR
jgi:hypothetical protein